MHVCATPTLPPFLVCGPLREDLSGAELTFSVPRPCGILGRRYKFVNACRGRPLGPRSPAGATYSAPGHAKGSVRTTVVSGDGWWVPDKEAARARSHSVARTIQVHAESIGVRACIERLTCTLIVIFRADTPHRYCARGDAFLRPCAGSMSGASAGRTSMAHPSTHACMRNPHPTTLPGLRPASRRLVRGGIDLLGSEALWYIREKI